LAISTQLHVCNTETQQITSILIKDPAKSHKTARNLPKPNQKLRPAGQNIATAGKKMTVFFQHSKLPTYKVYLAYHSMYTKSLQFPLGVTMMTYNTANIISKRTTQAVIGAMHVNRSLPQILAFTGTKFAWPGTPAPLL
jgi:hypothetical protein